MPALPCHIGVALFTFPGFPQQWVLVLSERRRFEGAVWCYSAIESVNGWYEFSKKCNPSLAAFDPTLLLSGVVHIAESSFPMKKLRKAVSMYKISQDSGLFLPGADVPERYAIGVLLHLYRGHFLKLPTLNPVVLVDIIQKRAFTFQETHCAATHNVFPVVRLNQRGIFYGRLPL